MIVSLVSGGVVLSGHVRDWPFVRRLAGGLPAPTLRTASPERATRTKWGVPAPVTRQAAKQRARASLDAAEMRTTS